MGKRVGFGGLLVILSACGGSVDRTPVTSEPVAAPQRDGDQGLYLPTKEGGPDHVADGVGTPSAIAMTADRVVFTTHDTMVGGERVAAGALFVADKRVGPALLVSVDRQGASYDALTTDGTTAFVATSDARLLAAPVAGGATTTLATLAAPAVALATAGSYVYVATNAGGLARVAKSGGAPEPLTTVTGAIRGLEADDAAVYVATSAADATPAGIVRVPLDGGATTVLSSGSEPCAMIRNGRSLFWTSLAAMSTDVTAKLDKGEVLRLSLDGGPVATVASGAFAACAIAADQDSLYFATTLPNALPVKSGGSNGAPSSGLGLMRAPIAGGEPVAIAQASKALAQPGAVAVDASHVYWLTESAVLRLAK
ncbi:MAG: hypothetical protein JWO86_6378 [Myxococcaceae bacterium]|nr:hypothetical protein [Myxococcaceae bacterium]